jgi:hypothetical protein
MQETETVSTLVELEKSVSEALNDYLNRHPEWDKDGLVSKAVNHWLNDFGHLIISRNSERF